MLYLYVVFSNIKVFVALNVTLCLHLFVPQLRREKIDLENTLEQEQEALVNRLWKRMDKLEAEKRWGMIILGVEWCPCHKMMDILASALFVSVFKVQATMFF